MHEIPLRALQGRNVSPDPIELVLCKLVHPLAWNPACITGFQDLGEFCQSETHTQRSLNSQNSLYGDFRIQPVPRLSSRSSGQDTDVFIMRDGVCTHPRCLGERSGMKSFGDIPSSTASINPRADSRVKRFVGR